MALCASSALLNRQNLARGRHQQQKSTLFDGLKEGESPAVRGGGRKIIALHLGESERNQTLRPEEKHRSKSMRKPRTQGEKVARVKAAR